MALDTQQKRQAIMNGDGFLTTCLPIPDASDFATQGERKLLLGLFSSITTDPPAAGGGLYIMLLLRGVG